MNSSLHRYVNNYKLLFPINPMEKEHSKLKPLFIERMKKLLPDKNDFLNYLSILEKEPSNSIRCNLLKISINELKKRLQKKGWELSQPWKKYCWAIIVESKLGPGELGRSLEHLLGYYYVQELASMLPVIALEPKPHQLVLDLCAAPGSKTTQIASEMKNTGTIIANEVSLKRLKILASNCERCGVTNAILTRKDGSALCKKFEKEGMKFDRILIDAPCSGEGTLRSSPRTRLLWNINTIKRLSNLQKSLLASAIPLLKKRGILVYSTCTHAPEENEKVVDWALKKFPQLELEKISLPLNARPGITKWEKENFSPTIQKCARIYPHDNNTEGFFIAKFKLKE